ncbi:hypothetical protein PGT21_015970 [Puccinia graminis f. sp. tritici]|uniref:Uncharacterized protein n=1 Tax=Puccinia graminis f. sp. tritici TaxID=56615 RepID=A0A5B0PEF2_PUCGR|nr:hypothetical protein PGT21_015970 [Puccinia graminis f. sp. tritici]
MQLVSYVVYQPQSVLTDWQPIPSTNLIQTHHVPPSSRLKHRRFGDSQRSQISTLAGKQPGIPNYEKHSVGLGACEVENEVMVALIQHRNTLHNYDPVSVTHYQPSLDYHHRALCPT